MQNLPWKAIKRIAPEQVHDILCRAMVMDRVGMLSPVGRRTLAAELDMSEREVRAAADSLKNEGILSYGAGGMALTEEGWALLPQMQALCRAFSGINELEQALSARLGIRHVTVVLGDADDSRSVLKDVGRAAALRLKQLTKDGMIIAISGGSTMYELARAAVPSACDVLVVPARGGFGSMTAIQADAVAEELAHNINATCRLMHLPDGLNAHALEELLKLPDIGETIRLMRHADIIIHGIGRADDMALRRGMDERQRSDLSSLGADGEALGDYFNAQGELVYRSPSLSAEFSARKPGALVLSAAAGGKKARAILSAVRHHPPDALIIDEAAANAMLRLMQ